MLGFFFVSFSTSPTIPVISGKEKRERRGNDLVFILDNCMGSAAMVNNLLDLYKVLNVLWSKSRKDHKMKRTT